MRHHAVPEVISRAAGNLAGNAARAAAGESETPCAGCSRRSFLSATVLTAVGALLTSACGDGVIGSGVPTGPGGGIVNFTVTLADYPALASVGGMARISGVSSPVAVVRTGASTYVALSLACPHQGTTVSIVAGGFRCPNHRATFSTNGTWTGGQRTSSLRTIPSTLDTTTGTLVLNGSAGSSNGGGDDDDGD